MGKTTFGIKKIYLKIFFFPHIARVLPEASAGHHPTTQKEQAKPALLQPAGLRHGLEASMGTGRPEFSIPDTTLLRRKCPDAWALRLHRCPVKTHWVVRPQAKEGRVLPAQPNADDSCWHQARLGKLQHFPHNPWGLRPEILHTSEAWHQTHQHPRLCQMAKVFKKVSSKRQFLYSPFPASRNTSWIKIYLVYDLCCCLWRKWPLFHIKI